MGLYYEVSYRNPDGGIDTRALVFDIRNCHGIKDIMGDDNCIELREWSSSSKRKQFGEAFKEPDVIAWKINGEWDWRQVVHTFQHAKQDFYIDTEGTSRAVLDTIWRHAVYEMEESLEYTGIIDRTGMPALSLAPEKIDEIKARAMSLWRHPCNDDIKRVYKELLKLTPKKPGEEGQNLILPWIIYDEDNLWNGEKLTEIFTERCTGPGTGINYDKPGEWIMPSGAVTLVDFVENLDGKVTYGMQLESGGDIVAMKAQTPEEAEEELLSAGAVMLCIHEDGEYVDCMIRNKRFTPPENENVAREDPSEDIMDP